jgi:hypothetical protein
MCIVCSKTIHHNFNHSFYFKFQVTQAIGYSVELVCHVEAYPRPTITWVHQGIQLSSNQVFYYKILFCLEYSLLQYTFSEFDELFYHLIETPMH